MLEREVLSNVLENAIKELKRIFLDDHVGCYQMSEGRFCFRML